MLSYAFQTLKQETYDDVAAKSFDEMYNLLAAILAKGIGLQLKQGLYREYISHQEELTVMRGKINMPGTIKNKLLHKQVLTCDFDELSENNTLNQILKTTVMLLLRNGKVKAKYKDDLKKKMLYFSNVDSIEPTEIKWSSIRFQRNNQTYRMLVSICQLMIEGMLITTDAGNYRLASFVDEQRIKEITSVTEMLEQGMTPEEILNHILGDMNLEILDTVPTEFYCNCSKDRVSKAVMSIGAEELQKMIDDDKPIEVNCHFCNSHYTFTVEELKQMLEAVRR